MLQNLNTGFSRNTIPNHPQAGLYFRRLSQLKAHIEYKVGD
jgi:hypothetical protein